MYQHKDKWPETQFRDQLYRQTHSHTNRSINRRRRKTVTDRHICKIGVQCVRSVCGTGCILLCVRMLNFSIFRKKVEFVVVLVQCVLQNVYSECRGLTVCCECPLQQLGYWPILNTVKHHKCNITYRYYVSSKKVLP